MNNWMKKKPKKRQEPHNDFETMKKKMLLYKQLGEIIDKDLYDLNEPLRKDTELCQ